MKRTSKINSVGDSFEACRDAFLVCESLMLKNDLAGRPTFVTAPENGCKDFTNCVVDGNVRQPLLEDDKSVDPAVEKMLERDREGLAYSGYSLDRDKQYVLKNGLLTASDYNNNGLVGQANVLAALKALEDAGFQSQIDFGILSMKNPKIYYIWYNADNKDVVKALAKMEASLADYALLDEGLHSALEDYACRLCWDVCFDNNQKADYWREHGKEPPKELDDEMYDGGEIEPPEFFNDNGDIFAMVDGSILSDDELKKAAEEYNLNLPESYFV